MVVLFGYMDFLIVFKWLQDWPDYGKNAPSIITVMIDLPLKLGKTVTIVIFRKTAVEENQCGEHTRIPHRIQYN